MTQAFCTTRPASANYGLPAATFTKVYANTYFGTLNGMTASCSGTPPADSDWGVEEDLDIEWAHAMAPNAALFLVEAASNKNTDLLTAVSVAALTVYDMCKALDKGIEIRYIQLERKSGGKSGDYKRPSRQP